MGQTKRVAVFGRADLQPDSEGYAQAEERGGLLAGAGFTVLNGGYAGAMEAVSSGAAKAGGRVEGVVCKVFRERTPNPYLTERVWAGDVVEQTRILVERADAYVALEPRTGTLAEVLTVWSLMKADFGARRPLVLVGPLWDALWRAFKGMGAVEENLLEWSIRVPDGRNVLPALAALGPWEKPQHG